MEGYEQSKIEGWEIFLLIGKELTEHVMNSKHLFVIMCLSIQNERKVTFYALERVIKEGVRPTHRKKKCYRVRYAK